MQGGKYVCANLSTQGAPVPGCNSLHQDQQVATWVAMNLINNYQPTLELELASYQHQLWVIQRNKHYHTPIHPHMHTSKHTCTYVYTHAHILFHNKPMECLIALLGGYQQWNENTIYSTWKFSTFACPPSPQKAILSQRVGHNRVGGGPHTPPSP